MKILGWMQNKLNGSNGKKKPNSVSVISVDHMLNEPCKQEFSDWPQALLAIGTFGINNLKENSCNRTNKTAEDSSSFQDCVQEEVNVEEVGNLQNDLNTYFLGHLESNSASEQEENPNDMIKKHLSTEHSSLEVEGRKENETFNFYPSSSLVYSRGKEHCLESLDKNKSAVDKKSLFFLLKKMFVCRSGFQPTPSFKDPFSRDSRMEKILRAILHKKMYPQGSSSTMFKKRYIETRPMPKSEDDDDEELSAGASNGCKWVKTDSEYIVLEI